MVCYSQNRTLFHVAYSCRSSLTTTWLLRSGLPSSLASVNPPNVGCRCQCPGKQTTLFQHTVEVEDLFGRARSYFADFVMSCHSFTLVYLVRKHRRRCCFPFRLRGDPVSLEYAVSLTNHHLPSSPSPDCPRSRSLSLHPPPNIEHQVSAQGEDGWRRGGGSQAGRRRGPSCIC